MTTLYTKSQIARLLGCDIRSKKITQLEPVAVAIMGRKEVDLFTLPTTQE